jgi:4-diphosphocytidyl-2-C-methyl-D-erythritol kinase
MKSFAKINISLEIKERQEKFHTLNTLICTLEDCYDVLEIQKSSKLTISTAGNYAFEGENILEKVAILFYKEFGGDINFDVKIQKNIKTGGGLGGGSSNAGVFLKFLLKQNGIFLSQKAFSDFVFKIGADVPFFYNNLPKMCGNYGEVLEDVNFEMPKELYALLLFPDFEINTKEAFANLDKSTFKPNSFFVNFSDAISSQNTFQSSASLINPEITNIIHTLKSLPNIIKADISGSGATCFALFTNKKHAEEGQSKVSGYKTFISKILT